MFAKNKLSDWEYSTAESAVLTTGTRTKVGPVSVRVPEKQVYRRIYLAGWFNFDPTFHELALDLEFSKDRSVLRTDNFGILAKLQGLYSGSLSELFSVPPPLPPFSFSRIAWASLPVNPPSLQGGDMPGQLTVCDPDLNGTSTNFIRMTPWLTVEECDEIKLSATAYTATGTPTVRLWLGVHSCAVPFN